MMGRATTPARPPFPPFTRDSAIQKVRLAEDAWNMGLWRQGMHQSTTFKF